MFRIAIIPRAEIVMMNVNSKIDNYYGVQGVSYLGDEPQQKKVILGDDRPQYPCEYSYPERVSSFYSNSSTEEIMHAVKERKCDFVVFATASSKMTLEDIRKKYGVVDTIAFATYNMLEEKPFLESLTIERVVNVSRFLGDASLSLIQSNVKVFGKRFIPDLCQSKDV